MQDFILKSCTKLTVVAFRILEEKKSLLECPNEVNYYALLCCGNPEYIKKMKNETLKASL
jgi:hypothetical protein